MSTPYVYKLTHKTTNQFYIGFRCNNKIAPADDIIIYQSSSTIVKSLGFVNFDIEIMSTFDNKTDAYDFEQKTIFENIHNPLILNKSVFYGGKRFLNHGHSIQTRDKMSLKRKGVKKTEQMINKMRATKTGMSKPSGRDPHTDPVAITNIQRRIRNFKFNSLEELSDHIRSLASVGMSNVKISSHLNISQTSVAKYKSMFKQSQVLSHN